ncbi:GATA zinc finger domain-containing protein 1 [Caerostris extrusa]|uniref:GATA zinc finger domain-containing protein 1 n=1 Tax=Caerostris extrusa TaxID=172846 RepID=A0AAV4PPM6_CAEEX|nr:GATA zinc finger domain-containing protein 1 [Caerostris extrusa]
MDGEKINDPPKSSNPKVKPKQTTSVRGRRYRRKNRRPQKCKMDRPIFVPISTGRVEYNDMTLVNGDVVSVVNAEKKVFYAQIRCLLRDQYHQVTALLTWLYPTKESPEGQFDPATYTVGHEDDVPRPLDALEFVSKIPSEYYKHRVLLGLDIPDEPDLGYALTSKGYKLVTIPCAEFETDSD